MAPGKTRGQITILLVLAVVLLIMVAFLIFVRGIFNPSVPPDLGDPELAKEAVSQAIVVCIQDATDAAIYILGMQGGALYRGQIEKGSPFVVSAANGDLTLPYEGNNISFAIREDAQLSPPDYPMVGQLGSKSVEGLIGRNTLIPLCDADGPNVWDRAGADHTCTSYDLPRSSHSIQDYLNAFIYNSTLACIDFPTLEEQLGTTIVSVGEPATEVLFGDSDVEVTLTYPMEIAGISVDSFVYKSNVRLKKIYELAYRIVQEDNSNLAFFVTEQDSLDGLKTCPSVDRKNFNEPCLKPGMSVTVIDAPCTTCTSNKFADIIRITDTESFVSGDDYVFQFARENRAPALDLIDEAGISGAYSLYLQMTHGIRTNPYRQCTENPESYDDYYSILINANDMLHLMPYILDPDEDTVTFSYEGWKTGEVLTDHDHHIKKSCGGMIPCTDPFNKDMDPTSAGQAGDVNYWEVNAIGSWDNHRTSYKTLQADIGFKLLRITISDTEGLFDSQDLGIFINDVPTFTMTGTTACCIDCPIILSSTDEYYSNYRVEIYDNQNVCVNQTYQYFPIDVSGAWAAGYCGDGVPRDLTLTLSDEFGTSATASFSSCSS